MSDREKMFWEEYKRAKKPSVFRNVFQIVRVMITIVGAAIAVHYFA